MKGTGKKTKQVKTKTLSPQHDRFCREYIVDENAVRAYQRAYKESPATYESAAASATRLLKDVKIQDRIQKLREERNKRLEVSADKILAELSKLAFSDPRAMFDDDGQLKPVTELDADVAAAISSIDVTQSGVKVRMADKRAALELLGRNLSMWKDVGSKENPAEMVHRVERVMVRPQIETNTKD